jgi:hypothetical protein
MVKIVENGGSPPEVVEAPALCDSGGVNGGSTVAIVGVGAAPALLVCDSAGGISVKVL